MKINIIVAYSDNYVIGDDDKIPWNYKEDLKYFYKITTITDDSNKKNVVIMGYNTYNSLPVIKLKNRVNIVITSKSFNNDTSDQDLYFVDSMGSSMELCQKLLMNNTIEKIFIIGGEKIYKYYFTSYYYRFLDKVYITRIHKNYDGNKFFYGLEEKFYYIDIKKSINNHELEYRVLQYNNEFINPEMKYLTHLNKLIKIGTNNFDKILNKEVLSFFEFNLNINLYQYFPLFSMIKNNKNIILEQMLKFIKNDGIKIYIDKIINKESNYINLIDIQPFNSIYYFNFHDDYLSCNVNHTKGNLLHDVLNNIIFSSLVVTFISKLLNLKPFIIKYNCIYNYVFNSDISNIEKIILNTPDVLPLLNIINNNQKNIEDFKISDLEFLGLKI